MRYQFLNPALMILRVAMGISYENHITHASDGRVSPAYSDIENKVPKFTQHAPLVLRPRSSSSRFEEISSEVIAIGFATDADSTIQEVHTDAAMKNGPWSARNRWSMKTSPASMEQPSAFCPQS